MSAILRRLSLEFAVGHSINPETCLGRLCGMSFQNGPLSSAILTSSWDVQLGRGARSWISVEMSVGFWWELVIRSFTTTTGASTSTRPWSNLAAANTQQSHFVHFDRYNPPYNPDGIRHLPIPECGVKFDIIIAFSVFTHAHPLEMLELVVQLRSMLTPHGALAFTFTDPSYDRSLSDPRLPSGTGVRALLERYKALIPAIEIEEMVKRAEQSSWCLTIDDKLYIEPGDEFSYQQREGRPGELYSTYFKPEWIKSLFPDGRVCAPVSPEWQHCCILRKL